MEQNMLHSLGKRPVFIGKTILTLEVFSTGGIDGHFIRVSEEWINDRGRFTVKGDAEENTTKVDLKVASDVPAHTGKPTGVTLPSRIPIKKIKRKVL